MATTPPPEHENDNEKRPPSNTYMKYMGMAFQMGITIAVGVLLGKYLDRYFQTDRPYFSMLCAIIFTAAAVYLAIKDFLKEK